MSSQSKLAVRVLHDYAYPAWRAFVAEAPSGSIYSLPEYLEILCAATGGSFRIAAVVKGEEILGGIALYEENGRAGTILSNRLLLYYNSIVLRHYDSKYPSERTSRQLGILAALESFLTGAGYARTVVHCRHEITDARPFLAAGWQVRPSYSYEVDISDIDVAFGRVEQNLRRLIRRAGDSGLTVDHDDDFDSFYALHLLTHKRKGAPVYLPREAFKTYFSRLRASGLGRLYHARTADGRSVAAQLVLLGPHPVTHTVTAGADPEFLKTGSTPFLRWKAFEDLARLGYLGNDLTDASLNPVTRFKSQLGGSLVTNLVVSLPDSGTYRMNQRLTALPRKGRAAAGRLLRSITGTAGTDDES
jgi:hypothetical protein